MFMTKEEWEIFRSYPDPRPAVNQIFREALKRHGLTGKNLKNEHMRHTFSVGCNRIKAHMGLCGRMYCPELMNLIYKPISLYPGHVPPPTWDGPVFQYMPEVRLKFDSRRYWPEGREPDFLLIEEIFERAAAEVFAPAVHACTTPREAARFAMEYTGYTIFGAAKINEVLKTWADHYDLEFIPRTWSG